MGHALSSPSMTMGPFVVDLETKKAKGRERLVALALTQDTTTNSNSLLFERLYAARCDESVRHWFQAPKDRTVISPAPSKEAVYEHLVALPTKAAISNEKQQTAAPTPLPIVLIKLSKESTILGPKGDLLPATKVLEQNPEFEVVGYFGCRFPAAPSSHGSLEMFLASKFNNEAKSVAILEIAARCYQHFAAQASATRRGSGARSSSGATPWPKELHFEALDSNMPCLRLWQKLIVSSKQTVADRESSPKRKSSTSSNNSDDNKDLEVAHDTGAQKVTLILRGSAVHKFADHLASQVTKKDDHTFCMRPRPVEPTPSCVVHPVLDAVIAKGREHWTVVNRPVMEVYAARAKEEEEAKAAAAAAAAAAEAAAETASSPDQTAAPEPLGAFCDSPHSRKSISTASRKSISPARSAVPSRSISPGPNPIDRSPQTADLSRFTFPLRHPARDAPFITSPVSANLRTPPSLSLTPSQSYQSMGLVSPANSNRSRSHSVYSAQVIDDEYRTIRPTQRDRSTSNSFVPQQQDENTQILSYNSMPPTPVSKSSSRRHSQSQTYHQQQQQYHHHHQHQQQPPLAMLPPPAMMRNPSQDELVPVHAMQHIIPQHSNQQQHYMSPNAEGW